MESHVKKLTVNRSRLVELSRDQLESVQGTAPLTFTNGCNTASCKNVSYCCGKLTFVCGLGVDRAPPPATQSL